MKLVKGTEMTRLTTKKKLLDEGYVAYVKFNHKKTTYDHWSGQWSYSCTCAIFTNMDEAKAFEKEYEATTPHNFAETVDLKWEYEADKKAEKEREIRIAQWEKDKEKERQKKLSKEAKMQAEADKLGITFEDYLTYKNLVTTKKIRYKNVKEAEETLANALQTIEYYREHELPRAKKSLEEAEKEIQDFLEHARNNK